jgi:hypothetical protein
LKMKVEVWKEEEHKQPGEEGVYSAWTVHALAHGPPVGEVSMSTLRKYQGAVTSLVYHKTKDRKTRWLSYPMVWLCHQTTTSR